MEFKELGVRVSGPLAGHAEGFAVFLAGRGSQRSSIVGHVRSMMHVSRWLESSRVDPGVMNEELSVKMLDELHRGGRALRLTPVSMRVVLGFLRSVGVVPPIGVVAVTPAGELLDSYRRYLETERCLAAGTVPAYISLALGIILALGICSVHESP